MLGTALTTNQSAQGATIILARGTGFFVSKQGHVLTNFHVVDACRQITIQSGRANSTARVVALDVANDLALLSTNLKPSRIASWRYAVEADEPVTAYGFPAGPDRMLHGKVFGLAGSHNSKLFYAQAGLEHGMSGSAIVDGRGLVVGVNVHNLNLTIGRATSSVAAGAFLDAQKIPHPEGVETKPLSTAEVSDKAKSITVKVTCQLLNQQTDMHVCGGISGVPIPDDKIIEACNRVITSGKLSGETLRTMYERRSETQLNKQRFDLAKKDCETVLQLFEDSDGFRCRARAAIAAREYGLAIVDLDAAIRLFPRDILALWMRAIAHTGRNELDRALADLGQALDIDPSFPNAYLLRGAIAKMTRQPVLSGQDLDRAVDIYSDLLKLYSTPVWRAALLAQRASAYNAKGDRDHAIADFDRALQIMPGNGRLISARAQIVNTKSDPSQPVFSVDRAFRPDPFNEKASNDRSNTNTDKHDRPTGPDQAVGLNPSNANAFVNRGNAYNAKGDRDHAIADYDQAIRLDASSAIAYYNRAIVYNMKGARDRAIADYTEAIRLAPNYTTAFHNRGLVYIATGDHDRAIADYDEAIRLDPKYAAAFNSRGVAYRVKGDYDRALAEYTEAIRLDPIYVFAFYNRGLAYSAKGDNERAIADYDEAIRLDPKYAAAFNSRGVAYRAKGDNDRAVADYDEAIRLDPKYALAFRNRGLVYGARGDNDRAIADHGEAIRLDPKYAAAFNSRGVAYRAKGDSDRAIADYSEAIRLDPKYALAFYNRGVASRAKGDNEPAIADYDEAIRLNPKYAAAFNSRGLAYRAKGDNDRAIADYTEAIRLNPNYAAAFQNRGLAYRATGDNDRAIADYTEAIRLNPKNQSTFNNRGFVYHDKSDNDRAAADFDEAIRLNPATALKQRGRWHFYLGEFEKAAADLLHSHDLRDDAYTMLWRYLSLAHMRQDGTAELSASATRIKSEDWPHAVIAFYLGQLSLDEMRAAARNVNEKCELAFYVGEWELLRGNRREAKESLQVAADNCPRNFVEYDGAISELKRLGR